MKFRQLLKVKNLLWSLGIASMWVLLLFTLTVGSISSRIADTLLKLGAFLANLAGFGAHDLEGLVLYILGNIVFHAVICLLAFWLLRRFVRTPDSATKL